MAQLALAAGHDLFEVGDEGEDVFVIESGEFDVIAPTEVGGEIVVGELGPGDVVGEITAIIGGRRTATVRARTDAVVRGLDADGFDALLAERPGRAAELAAEARARIDRTRVARVAADLVGAEHTDLIEEMTDAVDWVTLEAGQALFHQGDSSDAAYILVGGQMRVTAEMDGQVVLDVRIGRGDLLGEMGVIEQAPRTAGARAIRDCTLARIPKDEFERLTAKYPALMLPLVRKVIARVNDRGRSNPHAGNIAIIVTAPAAPADLITTICDEIARHGATLHLDSDRVARFFHRREIGELTAGSVADVRLTEFLHEVDVAHRWVVLECDRDSTDWTHRCIRTADRVVLVASAHPGVDERSAIAEVRKMVEATGDYDYWVAQLNPSGIREATGAAALHALSGAHRLVHLRRGDAGSVRRVARLLSGTGTGVAFSGGGARSYGQIGALRAMKELGIEIDALAGTSMGSVIGAFTAMVDDIDYAMQRASSEFNGIDLLDYTLPVTSIFRAKKMSDAIDRTFHSHDIEDLLIPFVCLSTNLSQAELVEHRSGPLVPAIRASVSLPGVFPPVAMGDDLLVDGGVLENLPAGPLRRDPGISTVIAIDVAPTEGPQAGSDYGLDLSGFEVLRRRLQRDTEFRTPALAHTVISSMLVGSSRARLNALQNADIDLYVSLDLSGVKLLDFDKFDFAFQRGYEDALPSLKSWIEATGR